MQYERLTKIVSQGGKECVACTYYGTEKCRIHSVDDSAPDCYKCNVFAAILNQLYAFEEILTDKTDI